MKNLMYKGILCFVLAITGLVAHAGKERYVYDLQGSAVTSSTTFTHFDARWHYMNMYPSAWGSEFTNYSVKNRLILTYDRADLTFQSTSFTTTVNVTATWTEEDLTTTHSKTVDLVVDYNPSAGTMYTDIDVLEFTGGHKVEVTINSITGTNPGNLLLRSEMEIERYYDFDETAIPTGPTAVLDTTGGCEELLLHWPAQDGAEEYELEFVFINDYDTVGQYLSASELEYDFRFNATRVVTPFNHYRLTPSYEHGYLLYRVRGVGRHGSDFSLLKPGQWSAGGNGTVNNHTDKYAITTPYEGDSLNWSYQVVYTEGGRKSESVSFADGLMMGRQSSTRSNAHNEAIVQEVYYDHFGRAGVSTLPTPTDDCDLKFREDFNRNASGDVYDRDDFAVDGDSCAPATGTMHPDYGSARYYSDQNPDQDGYNAWIPDADSIPFVQVEYMADGTGRIRRQSGAGSDFQLGSGHEVLFEYGTPTQLKLNRLFGTEAGEFSKYQRNVVTDGNGQRYITYLDMHGRVVASSLAGATPDSLFALDSNTGAQRDTANVLDNSVTQDLDVTTGSLSYTRTFTTDYAGAYLFAYDMNPGDVEDTCLINNVCFDCVYDLGLYVTDAECGDTLFVFEDEINGSGLDSLCNGASSYSVAADTFAVNLEIGTYVVSKMLSVDQASLDYYTDQFIDNNSCLLTYQDFYEQVTDSLDLSGCGIDPCEWEFIQENGTRNEYIDGGGTGSTYDALLQAHMVSCYASEPCDKYREAMLMDLNPGGQYALYDTTGGVISASESLSVLNTSNSLPGTNHDWRNPSTDYLNPDGSTSYLVNSLGDSVKPGHSTITLDQFINSWQVSWAESLLPYHPEYCYLQYCNDQDTSHQYDFYMQLTHSYSAAVDSGFLNPLDMTTGVTAWDAGSRIDPYFNTGGGGADSLGRFRNQLNNFMTFDTTTVSIWEAAWLSVHCSDTTNAAISTCLSSYDFGGDSCTAQAEWEAFRALYLIAKGERYDDLKQYYAIENKCYNGCFGVFSFDNTLHDFDCHPSAVLTNCTSNWYDADGDPDQPCFGETDHLYADKQPVFGGYDNPYTQLSIADAQDSAHVYLDSLCATSCDSFAADWIIALDSCDAMDTISAGWLNALEAELSELCQLGCDSLHATGASTLPGSLTTANGNSTFEEVLAYYLGSNYENAFCNHLLLPNPPAYSNLPQLHDTLDIDTCACEKILYVDSLFRTTSVPFGINNPEQLFASIYGFPMGGISNLACTCRDAYAQDGSGPWSYGAGWGNSAVTYLTNTGYQVPDIIGCASCVNCTEVSDLVDYFETEYGGDTLSNYISLLANFMNDTLGYNLSGLEYIEFLSRCDTITAGDTTCYTSQVLPEFHTLFQNVVNNNAHDVLVADKLPLDTLPWLPYAGDSLIGLNGSGADYYWTCDGGEGCDDQFLVTHIGDPSGSFCEVELTLHNNALQWSQIVNVFDGVYTPHAYTCDSSYQFYLLARFRTGAHFVTDTLFGSSNCMPSQYCYCSAGGLALCNTPQLPEDPSQSCIDALLETAENDAWMAYNNYIDSVANAFQQQYITECLDSLNESLEMIYWDYEYHYTLYYYDQAGNLVKTVPPKGVDDSFSDASVNQARANKTVLVPDHSYQTNYRYNSFNQVFEQASPDGDTTQYWYDDLGRLVASQDARQRELNQYSYMQFDDIGRIVEAGQTETMTLLTDATALDSTSFATWLNGGTHTEITRTFYDTSMTAYIATRFHNGQHYLRMRISSVAYYETGAQHDTAFTHATHYSYDVHGNVQEVLQDIPDLKDLEQDIKRTEYEYDLISGNVHHVYYQKDSTDQYIHRYCYDEDNRLKEVYTSKEGSIWDRDAKYFYYKHGPLARVERGDYLVQGEDYVYTINGWIKGYNSATLDSTRDIGKDGGTDYVAYYDSLHRFVGRDSLGWILGYYNNDYAAISNPAAGVNFEAAYVGTAFGNRGGDLYNGNIRHVVSAIGGMDVHGNVYNYDQLQRIRRADVYAGLNSASNTWSGATLQTDYASRYTYDANGNLTTMTREGDGTGMDDLTYHYVTDKNRLDYVDDTEADLNYSFDIDDQNSGNYEYWDNGALLSDAHDEIDSIYWTVDRKVKRIVRESGSLQSDLEFEYDAFGNRILKIEKPRDISGVKPQDTWSYTYYMRDAAGNVMAVYDYTTGGDEEFWIAERNIYGAGRLGVLDEDKQLADYDEGSSILTLYSADDTTRTLGKKIYEFAGHTGNVNITATDRVIALDDGAGEIYGYVPDIVSTADYYPFGLQKSGRNDNISAYRYAFQGQEQDPEKTGSEGGSYNYTYRMHDPRIGRFFAVDPLARKYPFYSPYAFSGNRVMDAMEFEGLEPEVIINPENQNLTPLGLWFFHFFYAHEIPNAAVDFSNATFIIDQQIHDDITGYESGAITVGSKIYFTESYKGASLGSWLQLMSHEMVHVMQFNNRFGRHQAWNEEEKKLAWVLFYGGQLIGPASENLAENIIMNRSVSIETKTVHDNMPLEIEAINWQEHFQEFYDQNHIIVNGNVSGNKIDNIFLNNDLSDQQKLSQLRVLIDEFWEMKDFEEEQKQFENIIDSPIEINPENDKAVPSFDSRRDEWSTTT